MSCRGYSNAHDLLMLNLRASRCSLTAQTARFNTMRHYIGASSTNDGLRLTFLLFGLCGFGLFLRHLVGHCFTAIEGSEYERTV